MVIFYISFNQFYFLMFVKIKFKNDQSTVGCSRIHFS